jgi:hypothetical protein
MLPWCVALRWLSGGSAAPEEAPDPGAGYRPADDLVLRPPGDPVRIARRDEGDVVREPRGPGELRHEPAAPHSNASSTKAAASSARRGSLREPRGPSVEEVGQDPPGELVGGEAGRVEPAVAEADELAGCSGDRLALFVGGAREREGLEAGGRGVREPRLDLAQLAPRGSRPVFMYARLEQSEGVVVLSGERDETTGTRQDSPTRASG